MSCSNTLSGLSASCEATRKKGGFDKRFWVGSISDLDGVTFGSDQEVTALTFASTKGLKVYEGKRLKHGANHSVEVGENAKMRVQNFNAVLYCRSAAERGGVEELIDAEDVFVIAEGNHGQIEVYGINKGDNSQFDNYGLMVSTVEKNDGALLNDDTSVKMTFSGEFDNFNLVFDEGTALAANITAIEAYEV